MLEKDNYVKLFKVIVTLIFERKAFAKCQNCSKYLSLFEVYNGNCSICGKIDFNDIMIIKNIMDDEDSNNNP